MKKLSILLALCVGGLPFGKVGMGLRGISILLLLLSLRGPAFAQTPMGDADYSVRNKMSIGTPLKKWTNRAAYLELGDSLNSKKALLLPRGNKDSVSNAIKGLFFYNLPDNKIYYYNGSIWVTPGGLVWSDTASVLATQFDLTGYVPTSRTITINGTAQDLSANRTWNVGTLVWSDTASVLATQFDLTQINTANIYNSNGIISADRTLTGLNDTRGLLFDSLNAFLVRRNNKQRIYMDATVTRLNSPNQNNLIGVEDGFVRLMSTSNSNEVYVRADSTYTLKKLSYPGNIHGLFFPYSLVDKSYVDSISGGLNKYRFGVSGEDDIAAQNRTFDGQTLYDFNILNLKNYYSIVDDNNGHTWNDYMFNTGGPPRAAKTFNNNTQYEMGFTYLAPSNVNDSLFESFWFNSSSIPTFSYGAANQGTTNLRLRPGNFLIRLRGNEKNWQAVNVNNTVDTTWKPLAWNSADSTIKKMRSWGEIITPFLTSDTHFGNTNLTQTANRTYAGAGFDYTFNNIGDWTFNPASGKSFYWYGAGAGSQVEFDVANSFTVFRGSTAMIGANASAVELFSPNGNSDFRLYNDNSDWYIPGTGVGESRITLDQTGASRGFEIIGWNAAGTAYAQFSAAEGILSVYAEHEMSFTSNDSIFFNLDPSGITPLRFKGLPVSDTATYVMGLAMTVDGKVRAVMQTKSAISGSTPGIDAVLAVNQPLSTNRIINVNGFGIELGNVSNSFPALFVNDTSTTALMEITNKGTGPGLTGTANSSVNAGLHGYNNSYFGVVGENTAGGGGVLALSTSSTTNTAITALRVSGRSTGATAANFGVLVDMELERDNNTYVTANQIISYWESSAAGSETARLKFMGTHTSALETFMDIKYNGIVRVNNLNDTLAKLSDVRAGAGSSYTDEQAQDAIGAMIDASLIYVDATPLLQRAALTGDVTASAGSNATTIANDAVTYAKFQNISATSRFLGRITSGAGDAEELTGTQATSLLNVFTSSLQGLVPASGGGTTTFLRADGTFAAPAGSGTVNTGASGKATYYPGAGTTVDDFAAVDYATSGNLVTITQLATTDVPLLIQLASSSAEDAMRVKNSGGTTLMNISKDGYINLPTGSSGSLPLNIGNNGIFNVGGVGMGFFDNSNGYSAFLGGSGLVFKNNTAVIDLGQQGTFSTVNRVRISAPAEGTIKFTSLASTAETVIQAVSGEATAATLQLIADEGDDAADTWKISNLTGNDLVGINNTTENFRFISTGGLVMPEIAAPSTPAANFSAIYVKADGLWYGKDDAGVETQLSNAASSGANTALSNLAAVAINTSLLPATDDAIDLGSATKQWRDLYLTGASIYLAGTKTLSTAGLDLPTGGGIRTRTTAGNTVLLQAYDVDGTAYTTFATLTANNTPTLDFSTAVTFGGATLGATYQPLDGDLTAIAGLTATTDNFIVGVASAWASRTPAQVRTTLGLVIGTNVQAWDADLDTYAGLTPTTVGQAYITLPNPSAISFIRINADNTITARSAANFKTDLSLTIGTNIQAWDADLDTWAGKTPYAGTLTITTGKTVDFTNSLTFSGTDASTLNIGAGGTLGSNAYTSTAYVPTSTTVAGFALSGNVTLAALSATDATLTFSGSYTGATARTVGLNLGQVNNWTTAINEAKGADIASSGTTDIGAATGNYIDVTGTNTITALGTVQAGTRRIVRFTGALILTHNATSLILPGAANITTVAGDVAIFISLGSGNWRCISYTKTTTTGTGSDVFATSPTFVTPTLGAATATTINGNTFTAGTYTLTGVAGKTLTFNKSITLEGTDATTMTFPSTSATIARTDAANSFTGVQTMTSPALTTPAITGLATGSGVASAATVSTLAARDANGNLLAVGFIPGYTTTATAAGTTTMTIADNQQQYWTGSTTQTVKLPTTGIVTGAQYRIVNNSTGAVTVQSSGANTIIILAASTEGIFTAVANTPTAAADWSYFYRGTIVTSAKSLSVSNTLTLAGTDGTTMTFPTTSKTIAANDGSNWTISGQAIGDLLVASSTTAYGKLADVAAGSYLRSGGVGAAPVWSTLTLPNAATTGDILTATSTNGIGVVAAVATGSFLMSQGTSTAPIYQNTRENWTSFSVVTSDATTTGQTMVDVTGLVSGTLTNSTTYEVEAMLYVTTTAVTTGTQYAITGGGSGTAATVFALQTGTTTTNAGSTFTQSATAVGGGTFLTTASASGIIWIKGIITTRGSGTATISIQHLKVTSGTSTVKVGSWMKIRLLN